MGHPQHSLPNQLDGGVRPSGGSCCSGAVYAETSTSATEQGAVRSSARHCGRLACHKDISEAWRGHVSRGISNIVGDDIRRQSTCWGSCLDCTNSKGGQPASDVSINIVRCCRTRVNICGSYRPEGSHGPAMDTCTVRKRQWIHVLCKAS